MAQKTIKGNDMLAKQIKQRRNELGLTIEAAALRAGVGTKTWSRYEAGESIRADKCKGVCKALNWYELPDTDEEANDYVSIEEYRTHEAWSDFLEDTFGDEAAFAFAIGSDILLEHIEEDMSALASMARGSHIGQIDFSSLRDDLPEQFLVYYDYEFLYRMKCCLHIMRSRAQQGTSMIAHSVLEELIIFLCNEEASVMLELSGKKIEDIDSGAWVFDLFDDMDIVTCLYSNMYLEEDHIYHFSKWADYQFYDGDIF